MADSERFFFVVGKDFYSLPVGEVERIAELPASAVMPLPIPHEKLRGFLNLRGQAIPVVDFPGTADIGTTDNNLADNDSADNDTAGATRQYLILRADALHYAFAVTDTEGIRTESENETVTVLTAGALFDSIITKK